MRLRKAIALAALILFFVSTIVLVVLIGWNTYEIYRDVVSRRELIIGIIAVIGMIIGAFGWGLLFREIGE